MQTQQKNQKTSSRPAPQASAYPADTAHSDSSRPAAVFISNSPNCAASKKNKNTTTPILAAAPVLPTDSPPPAFILDNHGGVIDFNAHSYEDYYEYEDTESNTDYYGCHPYPPPGYINLNNLDPHPLATTDRDPSPTSQSQPPLVQNSPNSQASQTLAGSQTLPPTHLNPQDPPNTINNNSIQPLFDSATANQEQNGDQWTSGFLHFVSCIPPHNFRATLQSVELQQFAHHGRLMMRTQRSLYPKPPVGPITSTTTTTDPPAARPIPKPPTASPTKLRGQGTTGTQPEWKRKSAGKKTKRERNDPNMVF